MRLTFQYILVLCTVFCICGCEDQPDLFKEPDGIYFGVADTAISYSFAKYPNKLSDTLIVPVNVLGNSANTDRAIAVELVPLTGEDIAIEGKHFKLLDQSKISAKATAGTIKILVNRTADLESGKVVKFAIQLKKDQNFPADGIVGRQKLTINLAYLQKPASWGEFTGTVTGFFAGYRDNFGTWTPTKYKIILDALYDPATSTTVTEFPGSRFSPPIIYNQYLAIVRNYIKSHYPGNYGLGGAILTDPDNSNLPVQVGPANY